METKQVIPLTGWRHGNDFSATYLYCDGIAMTIATSGRIAGDDILDHRHVALQDVPNACTLALVHFASY